MKTPPFPQANNIELIYDLLTSFPEDGMVYSTVSKKYGIAERQGSYYLNALLFLDLAYKIKSRFFLSDNAILVLQSKEIKKDFCNYIINNNRIKELYFSWSKINDRNKQIEIISSYIHTHFNLNAATSNRRAESINNWFVWINNFLKEVNK